MFASRTVTEHLLRGLLGLVLAVVALSAGGPAPRGAAAAPARRPRLARLPDLLGAGPGRHLPAMTVRTRTLDADYLVVGAGATGMAFTDALIDHSDVRVALVDRRHGVGGHWLEAYPFVRLHQASSFYGVASTVLGGGGSRRRPRGGAARARRPARDPGLLRRRPRRTGWSAPGGSSSSPAATTSATARFVSRELRGALRGARALPGRRRALPRPRIPAETPPRFAVGDGVRVIPVNDLVGLEDAPSQYVVVGSGKTATDACVWLLGRGVDPDAICWVRPRDPWMLNRALIQPDPAIYLGMVADLMESRRPPRRARRPVPPARGRRDHAADRPQRSRRRWPRRRRWAPGSSTCCAPSSTSYDAGTSSRSSAAASSWPTGRSRSPTTRWSSTAPPTVCDRRPAPDLGPRT